MREKIDLTFVKYSIQIGGWEYYFSSNKNMETFIQKRRNNIDIVSAICYHYFGIVLDLAFTYADFQLYRKIERNGFKIKNLKTGKIYRSFDEMEVIE